MPSIDERVVAMSFENAKFEAAVAQTLGTLSKLDTAIKNIGQTNGLSNIEAAANKVNLEKPVSALGRLKAALGNVGSGAATGFSGIERAGERVTLRSPFRSLDNLVNRFGRLGGDTAPTAFSEVERSASRVSLNGISNALDNVSNKFSVMQGAASVALGNIASQAAMRGAAFAKSFALGPIIQGFQEYSTNLGSIQTILANTQDSGGNLKTVNAALNELNRYSDKTIYNFSEMAKNIGTFTAAGVRLGPATQSIKGIANLAALSGSNSQQASTAMYQLSQAIAAGKVGLQDWNSVVNAGMGGAVFQKALMRTAQNMGTVKDGAVAIDKATGKATINGQSFRESIMAKPGQQSWLTSDVLTKTLSQFTGDLKASDLAAQGFNASQIKAIQQTAKSAQQAATQVKTLPQVFDVARETIGSGWSKTFQLIFGDFGQSKQTFTALSNAINGFINRTSNARNAILTTFDKLGGRTKLIDAIKTSFSALEHAILPVAHAFRAIFPATTAANLLSFVDGFQHLADAVRSFFIQHGGQLQNTFEGFFAVLHIGVTIVKEAFRAIGQLLGFVGNSSGGFLSLTASVGLFLRSIDRAVTQGGVIRGIFTGLTAVLGGLVGVFKDIGRTIGNMFGGGSDKAKGLSSAMSTVAQAGGPLAAVAHAIVTAWDAVARIFDKVKTALQPAFDVIGAQAKRVAGSLAAAFSTGNFDKTMSVLQTGFLGGILLIIRRFRSTLDIAFSGGIFDKMNAVLGALTGNLKAMQQNLQAKTLFAIAASLGVLVAGIYVLSTIDGKKLTEAMTSMAVGMGELVGVMNLLGRAMSGPGRAGFLMMPFIAASMIELAVAGTILAAAMKIFATLSWEDLAKGLAGLGGSLVAIGLGMKLLGPMTLVQGPALIAIGIALNIMGAAVKSIGALPWKQLVQGILGLGFAFIAMAAGLNLLGPSLILTGPGLIAVGIGMNMLSGAIAQFGSMNIGNLAKGIAAVAASLIALSLGLAFIPPTVGITGAGLIVVAAGMTALSAAIGILGSMKVGTLVKGIAAMGASLVVLGTGLMFMSGTLAGSAALLVAASAMAILGPALGMLGMLKWSTILSGLGAVAVTLGVLALAGTVVAGPLTALSFALGALGIALGLITTPIFIFAKALQIMGASGTKGISVMVASLTAFVALLPNLIINFLKGIVQVIASIAELAPKVVGSIGIIIGQVLAVVVDAAPKMAVAAGALIRAFLKVINDNAGPIIQSGIRLLLSFLTGIANNIGKVTQQVSNIVVHFLAALTANLPRIIQAGGSAVVAYLTGVAANLGRVLVAAANLVVAFLNGITSQLPKMVAAGARVVASFLESIAAQIPRLVHSGVTVIVNFVNGIANNLGRVVDAGVNLISKFIFAIDKAALKLVNTAAQALIHFMNGLAEAIRRYAPQLQDAGFNIASAIIDGMVGGFTKLASKAVHAVEDIITALPKKAIHLLGIASPSKVFASIGENVMDGLANGISARAAHVHITMANALQKMVQITGDGKALGQFLGKSFTDGLTGSQDDITTAMDNFRAKLTEEQSKLADQVKADQDKLKKYMAEPGWKNPQMVAFLKGTLAQDQATLKAVKGASQQLLGQLSSEEMQLENLSAQYDQVGQKLQDARTALANATQQRDDAIKSYTDQYAGLPDINSEVTDQVGAYKQALKDQIAATEKYMATLQKLRALGLDDTTYKRLLSEGTKDQTFADQLVQGGAAAVQDINKLDAKLLADSAELAKQAANNLYQAGVDAAQGLVDGLVAQQDAIHSQMTQIAQWMVDAIKSALGIQSPSKVMAEIGKFSAQGVISGLRGASGAVASAAAGIGDDAAAAMSDSLARVANAVTSKIDMNPTITPVLDLTQVQKDATKLGDLTNVVPITAAASYGQATAISGEHQAVQDTQAAAEAAAVTQFNFEQTNISPEALSDVEIYRQTQNQLSQAKRALGLAIG